MAKYQSGSRLLGTEQNIALIKAFLDKEANTAIDIGCNEGFITLSLAKQGLSARGYEAQQKYYDEAVKKEGDTPGLLKFYNKVVALSDINEMDEFDVAVFLSVHHQLVKNKSLEYANEFLISLFRKCKKQMFFSPCAIHEKYGREMPFAENDYVAMSEYFIDLIASANIPGAKRGRFIGLSHNDIPKSEPFRPVIVFDRSSNDSPPSKSREPNILASSKPAKANSLTEGSNAKIATPRAELVYFNPMAVNQVYSGFTRLQAGLVVSGNWAKQAQPFDNLIKYRACLSHWVDGVAWKDTGIFEYMEKLIADRGRLDGCSSMQEIEQRYIQLDSIFEQVSRDRKILSRTEIDPKVKTELDGIYIHIGPNGEFISGAGGIHRLAIAKILKLDWAPAQIGCVHPGALSLIRQPEVQNSG